MMTPSTLLLSKEWEGMATCFPTIIIMILEGLRRRPPSVVLIRDVDMVVPVLLHKRKDQQK